MRLIHAFPPSCRSLRQLSTDNPCYQTSGPAGPGIDSELATCELPGRIPLEEIFDRPSKRVKDGLAEIVFTEVISTESRNEESE
jgi:hypothetical protein